MKEQEYTDMTMKVKLHSALQLLGDLSSYTEYKGDFAEFPKAVQILQGIHFKLLDRVDIEGEE